MDKKLLLICVLTVSAVALMIGNFITPQAKADTAVSGGGYQVATGRLVSGGEAVYIVDNRSGLMAVFAYDPNFKKLVPRDVRPVADAMVLAGQQVPPAGR